MAWVLALWSLAALAYAALSLVTQSYAILALSVGSILMLIAAIAGGQRSKR